MRRLVLALSATVILTVGASFSVVGIGDTEVTLNCDDGNSLTVVVDAGTLTGLAQAVQAMIDYPAGLGCTLIQSPLAGLLGWGGAALADSPRDFAVGGGQFINSNRGAACEQSFAVSAHSPDTDVLPTTANASGTANFSVSNAGGNTLACAGGQGTLVTKVDCLFVSTIGTTTRAKFTGVITQVTGTFTSESQLQEGNELAWEVVDATPSAADEINANYSTRPCDFTAAATPLFFSIDHGNITVRDN
jgi:hypothetical protein